MSMNVLAMDKKLDRRELDVYILTSTSSHDNVNVMSCQNYPTALNSCKVQRFS